MGHTKQLQQAISRRVVIAYLVLLPLTAIFNNYVAVFTGFTLGVGFSLINFHLLASTVERAVNMPPGKAAAYTMSRYLMRYLLTGLVIAVSLIAEFIDIKGTVVGLLLIKLLILANNIVDSREMLKKAFNRERA